MTIIDPTTHQTTDPTTDQATHRTVHPEPTGVPATMRTIEVQRTGGPEVLEPVVRPTPSPGPGQVLVRVRAAAVNYADVMRRSGDLYPFPTPLPFTPGSEVSGEVVALGPGTDGPPVGTPVFALVGGDGSTGYAEYAVADVQQAVPIPPGVSPEQACGILVAGSTAMLLLTEEVPLGAGEIVLVPAAAGGVGSLAVQIARSLGAGLVIGTVGTHAKVEAAREAGADVVVVTDDPSWPAQVLAATGGRGVDVALEMHGGATFDATLSTLAPFGRMAVYGRSSGEHPVLAADTVERWLYRPSLNQSVSVFNLGLWFGMRPDRAGAALGRLIGLVASGAITVPVGATFPLAAAADAHRALESRSTTGKVVLLP